MERSFFALKKRKGQTSIEFILIVLFIIIYIATVINPLTATANNSAEEISRLGNAKIAAEKIVDSIESIAIAPNSARATVQIFVPEKSEISCDNAEKKVSFKSEMQNHNFNPKECPPIGGTNCCTKTGGILNCFGEIALSMGMGNFNCDFSGGTKITGKAMKNITVENSAGNISVKYAQ